MNTNYSSDDFNSILQSNSDNVDFVAQKDKIMEQVRSELAMANAQELLNVKEMFRPQ